MIFIVRYICLLLILFCRLVIVELYAIADKVDRQI